MKETPQEIVVFLRQHKSSLEIAKAVGCSQELINKIASGERQNPRYQIMDGLRDLAKAVKRKTPRGNVGRVQARGLQQIEYPFTCLSERKKNEEAEQKPPVKERQTAD